jgi:hypothetical protein
MMASMSLGLGLYGCGSTSSNPGMNTAGCSSPTDTSKCSMKSQYVTDTITLATSAPMAVSPTYSQKLDGDANHKQDNALGSILAALSSMFPLNDNIAGSINNGKVILLWQYYASGALGAANQSPDAIQAFLGSAAGTSTCMSNDAGTGTCNFFSGSAMFNLASGSPTDAFLPGAVSGGVFTGGPAQIQIQLPFSAGGAPLGLTLYGAKVSGNVTSTGCPSGSTNCIKSGVIGGAIKIQDLNNTVIPTLASILNSSIAAGGSSSATILSVFDGDCTSPAPTECLYCSGVTYDANGNATGGTCTTNFTDADCSCAQDGTISPQEIIQNPLIKTTIERPDLDLFDGCKGMDPSTITIASSCVDMGNYAPLTDNVKDSESLGVAFTAVSAMINGAP